VWQTPASGAAKRRHLLAFKLGHIAMAQRIAHPIRQRPRHFGMRGYETRIMLLHISRGLADNFQGCG
jgi:hypothetical protein